MDFKKISAQQKDLKMIMEHPNDTYGFTDGYWHELIKAAYTYGEIQGKYETNPLHLEVKNETRNGR